MKKCLGTVLALFLMTVVGLAQCYECWYPNNLKGTCVQCVEANYVPGGLGGSDCLAVCGSGDQNYCILYCCCDPWLQRREIKGQAFPLLAKQVIQTAKGIDTRLMVALARIGTHPKDFLKGEAIFAFADEATGSLLHYQIVSHRMADDSFRIRVTVAERQDGTPGFHWAKLVIAQDGSLLKFRSES